MVVFIRYFIYMDIIRNTGYIAHVYSSVLKSGESYDKIGKIIQINLNSYDIDKNNKEIIDKYYFMNNKNHILTDNLQIYEINIDKCYEIWYNELVDNYDELDGEIIRLCALMVITDEEEFKKCLGEINMDKFVKKDIETTERHLSVDDELRAYYESDEEYEKWQRSKREYAERIAKENGIKQGIEKRNNELIKSMLDKNMDINLISEITELSVEQILSISNL